jgi:hypothetical protein
MTMYDPFWDNPSGPGGAYRGVASLIGAFVVLFLLPATWNWMYDTHPQEAMCILGGAAGGGVVGLIVVFFAWAREKD